MVTPSTPASQSDPATNDPATNDPATNETTAEASPALAPETQTSSDGTETTSLGQSWLYAGGTLLAIYGLFASISFLNLGFQSILGPEAEELLALATNPWLGLLLGILATALIQSSSIVTTLLVTLVAGGLPIATAIPMVMGANLGTTITNTLVSLGYIGDDDSFERGFAAATIHDCFNLIALLIFFPLELLLHPLERLSLWLLSHSTGLPAIPVGSPVDWLLQPVGGLMAYGINSLSGPWDALLLFGVSVGGLMVCVTTLGWLLKRWLDAPAQAAIRWAMGRGSSLGLVTGAGVTAMVQSSSMTTSLAVPLAGSGLVTLTDIYPFVLGANIGTCITALLATLSLNSSVALQLALVHLAYNLLAVLLIYGLPVLRSLPLTMAKTLAQATRQYRLVAIAYVIGMFFVLPFLALTLSAILMGTHGLEAPTLGVFLPVFHR
ncbi:MAG: Na/Pi symporter [Cyanobacteria bacterium P01_H01_bin.26]